MKKMLINSLIFIILAIASVVLVRLYAFGEEFMASMIFDGTTLGVAGLAYLCYMIYALLNYDKVFKKKKPSGDKPTTTDKEGNDVDQFANMRWVTDNELLTKKEFGFHFYSDLSSCKKDGVLIRSELQGKKLLTNMYDPIHTLILGTTGSGKTEGFVIPTINVLSSCATKPSLIITDPKGELYRKTGRKLMSSGYDIKVLDLKEPQKSTCWNPMEEAYKLFHRAHDMNNEVKVFRDINPADTEYKHIAGEYYNEWYGFDGKAYPTKDALYNDIEGKKDMLKSRADDILHDIAIALCPIVNTNDSSWERGAQDLIWGVMTAMLEDSLDPSTGMTLDKFNLYNVNKIVSYVDVGEDPYYTLRSYLMSRDKKSPVISRTTTSVNNAPGTTKSYMGIVLTAMSLFSDVGIAFATSKNEMDFDTFSDNPSALYIRVPDDVATRHPIATMMISRVYKNLVDVAENRGGKLKRNVYFIMDEFANLPKIPNFDSMITVARSRGIFFEMVVQSYSQLDAKYGNDVAKTIKENCNIQIYIGSDDTNTKKEFSELCGNMTIRKKSTSKNTGKDGANGGASTTVDEVTRPLIYPDELSVLPSETVIVKIFKQYPMKVKLNHAYKYPMFTRQEPDQKYTPIRRLKEEDVYYDIGEMLKKRRSNSISIFD